MKTFIYTYERKRNDINGNPKHWVTVYRIKRGVPDRLGRAECGYVGKVPTALHVAQKAGEITRNQEKQGAWKMYCNKVAVFHELD
jgi:hypothetical protein